MNYHYILIRMAKIKKKKGTIPIAGEDIDKLNCSYIDGWNVNDTERV